ncbi:protein disulfide isomerase CRELD2-like isoform X2 [Gigantopelta aegis]|uniref:protein disulfide isomerase CRELD2-like isoform X2 n=1 Tax=Gigantopelta aegis TaxID=1735272 RepID=UPI001B887592|nr:protein disulfide isomerase CRELD2-like isoform X2 [Gigantopelta aegis]
MLGLEKVTLLLGIAVVVILSGVEGKKKIPSCTQCKEIAKHFEEGLKKTARSNYGGGNTNWEEKSLGKYAKSEVRLVEIMDEHLCSGGSKECHQMLEEYEDAIESFWFKVYAKSDDTDFHRWFCIDTIKACCPENHYGPDCAECSGGSSRPCFGNGNCDGGGTREGTGKCSCHSGYTGTLCDDCLDGYYESLKNDTHTVCKPCHISCKKTCSEEGPKGCDECNTGWLPSEEHGCQDIDECAVEEPPCNKDQYCVNTAGSYTCFSCNEACDGCAGPGPDKCDKCKDGFTLTDQTCIDNDECQADPTLCLGENERCENRPGTYSCECIPGFWRQAGKCVPKPKEEASKKDDEEKVEEEEEDDKDDDNEELPSEDSLPPMPLPKLEL